ncbi:MAG: enoyl-CoA hydratase/isomerase family protein [Bdellovibrionales bacterium]|nr:enoyl-CoA hydratase/isomerase family protein [Bdellovibrionales bacterium]
MDQVVSCNIEDFIATLTIERESALNALNEAALNQLREHIGQLAEKSFAEVRVVVLKGAGEKAFVAGADIKLMQQASEADLRRFIALGQEVMSGLEQLRQPVVAAVQGFAIGGGMELALAADIIVASKKAKFGQAETNLGLIPGFGGTQRLALRSGIGSARALIFGAETISAEEAHRLHIVDYLVEPDELDWKVAQVVSNLLAKGPLAISAAKRAIQHPFRQTLSEGLENEVEEFVSLFGFSDTKEGLNAFVEKRKPQFRGE